MRYRYEPHPCVKLGNHEYKMIINVVEGMIETLHIRRDLTMQAIALPPTSFRPNVAIGTLSLAVRLPL